jgi:hypothetical protein
VPFPAYKRAKRTSRWGVPDGFAGKAGRRAPSLTTTRTLALEWIPDGASQGGMARALPGLYSIAWWCWAWWRSDATKGLA